MVAINPHPHEIGRVNAFVGGRARRYDVAGFTAPLSVKTVLSGTATWVTPAGEFEIGPAGSLIVNADEPYSMVVDAPHPVETRCVFFARGFAEEALASAVTSSNALLDAPRQMPLEFAERLQRDARLRALVAEPGDESVALLARRLVELHTDVAARAARLPALRASTRVELHSRVARGVEMIHGNLAGDLSLERVASAACLAPFHFHRVFTAMHGMTPHRYITRLRLDRAEALLAGSDRPVADIAFSCGFDSLGSFTALFRRDRGVTPGQFRKNRETVPAPAQQNVRP